MGSVGNEEAINDALNNVKYQMIENMLKVVLTQLSVDRNQNNTTNEENNIASSQLSSPNSNFSSSCSSHIAPGFSVEIPFHVPFRTPYASPKNVFLEIKEKYKPLQDIEDPLREPHILNPLPPYEGFKTPLDPGILNNGQVSRSFGKFDNLCFPIRCTDGYLTIPLTEDEFYDLLLGKEVRLQTNIHLQCYSDGQYLKVPGISKLPSNISKGMISTARGTFHRAAMFHFCMVHNLMKLRKWSITYREDNVILNSKFYEKQMVSLPYPQFDIRYLDHSYLTEMKYIHYCILISQYYSTLAQQLIDFIEKEQPMKETMQVQVIKTENLIKTEIFTSLTNSSEFEVASCSTELSDPPEDPCPQNVEEYTEEVVSSGLANFGSRSGPDTFNKLIIKPYSRLKKEEHPEHSVKQEVSPESRNLLTTTPIFRIETEPVRKEVAPDEVRNRENPTRLKVDENDYAAALFLSSLKTMPMFAARPSLPTIELPQRKRRKTTVVEGHMNVRTAPKKARQY